MSNITNATAPAVTLEAITTNVASGNNTSINTTSTSTNNTVKQDNDEAIMTMLTFGPLSSCITLPDLSARPLPSQVNLSSSAVQAWLTSLPSSSSCSPYSWVFKPDYSEHLNAMATFQQQLEQIFPTTNSTLAVQTGVNDTSTAAGNSSFFGSTSVLGSTASSKTLPTGLPVWMGVTVACAVLVHLVSLILHICSDLEALLPSLAVKLHPQPDEAVLPSHASPSNQSSATLVDAKTDQKTDVDVDAKVADPPGYTEPAQVAQTKPSVDYATMPTPALIRMSRKVKRFVVPLLLLSALASIGVAVVLNSKFAAGPVISFPTSFGSVLGIPVSGPSSSASVETSNSSTSSGRSDATPTASASQVASSTRQRASPTTANTTNTIDLGSLRDSDTAAISSTTPGPAATATASMTRLVRRQNFFPTISPSLSSNSASTAVATSSLSPSSAASSISSTPLFPAMPVATSLSSPSTTSLSASPSSTTATSTSNNSTANDTSSDDSSGSRFVLEKGDSMHRIWWIVMLDLMLWFAQRRRTRNQTAMDKARTSILDHLTASHLPKM